MRSKLIAILAATTLAAITSPAWALPATLVADAGFAAGPGSDYDVLAQLNIGTKVNVVWCGTHENWCLVEIHNKQGWVPLASIAFKTSKAVAEAGGAKGTGAGGTTPADTTGDATKTMAEEPATQAAHYNGGKPAIHIQGSGITVIKPKP